MLSQKAPNARISKRIGRSTQKLSRHANLRLEVKREIRQGPFKALSSDLQPAHQLQVLKGNSKVPLRTGEEELRRSLSSSTASMALATNVFQQFWDGSP